jgi:hypothetical protein
MLGVRSEHKPLRGKAAKKFLSKLVRVQTGHLNEEDRKEIANIEKFNRENKIQEIEWEF